MSTTKPPASPWATLARRPFASLVAAVWVTYAGLTAFVVAIDPFDLFPWGARVTVPTRFDPGNVTRLMRIAAKDAATDTVLIGSSNSAMFTPDDIKAAFPDAHQVWNVSYHGATAYDRLLTTDQFLKYSNARHFIFVFDYFYAQSIHRADNDFPDQFYLDNPMKHCVPEHLTSRPGPWRRSVPLSNASDETTGRPARPDVLRALWNNTAARSGHGQAGPVRTFPP